MRGRVVILGGGISGLAAAWYCKRTYRDAVDVTVLERTARFGGWIQTVRQEGFLFELGPRSCRSYGNGVATLRLIEELGLQQEVITASPASRRRFLYFQQQLRPLPRGLLSFLSSPLTRPLLWPLIQEWWKSPTAVEDESVHSFFKRRLGRYAAETLVDPLVAGIYAGDAQQLSMKSCFPQMHAWEQQHGSLLKGMLQRSAVPPLSPFVQKARKKGLFSLRGGMQQLTDTLYGRLDADLRLQCEATAIDVHPEGFIVHTAQGDRFEADHLVSCLPAHALARIMLPSDALLAEQLSHLHTTSVAVVCFGYHHRVLNREGFGYLIPSSEGERLLGVVWDSSVFPEHNQTTEETRLTCMIGGEHMPNFAAYSADDFIAIAREGLERHLGIRVKPDVVTIKLATQAIPQYTLGHSRRVAEITRGLQLLSPRLRLLGNSYSGVAVNDCIAEVIAEVTSWTTGKRGAVT